LDYHILMFVNFELNPEIMIMLRLQVRMVYPLLKIFRFEFKYDFHRVKQIYATYAATDPDVNAIYIYILF